MKNYLAEMVDLTGDSYINPVGATYGDGSGTHQRRLDIITSISIHHDAATRPHDYDSAQRYRNEAAAHYRSLGPGLQYHYKIDNVGQIFKIRPISTWLYVVGSSENVSTIAICLDGYLHDDNLNLGQNPTREQGEALFQLLQELCENHPEFPATWPDVRPHADFSATACCGSRLKPHIYPITSRATAEAQLLNQWEYDWPEYQQPASPTPAPTPTPVPTPAPTPPSVTINYRVFKAGKQIGAYTVDKNAWNKYVTEGDQIKDGLGNDVTSQLKAKFDPPKPPEPTPSQQDHEAAQDARLSAIEKMLKTIWDYLMRWKRFKAFSDKEG